MSVHEIVANVIIDKLKQGVVPWKPTWRLQTPVNYISKRPYTGINLLLLSLKNYPYPYYLTMKQINDLHGLVSKGESGHIVTYLYAKSSGNHNKPDEEMLEEDNVVRKTKSRVIRLLRYYNVWNISQTNLVDRIQVQNDSDGECDSSARIVNSYRNPPDIFHASVNPHYNKRKDAIKLPEMRAFDSNSAYFATLFHELIHSTGHQKRLSRVSLLDAQRFGSDEYSLEELVAEIGAFMLCSEVGIAANTIENSAAYIKGWLEVLKNNHQLLFTASRLAQEACEFLLSQ